MEIFLILVGIGLIYLFVRFFNFLFFLFLVMIGVTLVNMVYEYNNLMFYYALFYCALIVILLVLIIFHTYKTIKIKISDKENIDKLVFEAESRLTTYELYKSDKYFFVRVYSIGSEYVSKYLKFLCRERSRKSFSQKNFDKSFSNFIKENIPSFNNEDNVLSTLHSKFYNIITSRINSEPNGNITINYALIKEWYNLYENDVDVAVFESLHKEEIYAELNKINNLDISIFLPIKNHLLSTDSIYCIGFKNKEVYIEYVLNPTIGYVRNIGKKKFYFFLSIGAVVDTLISIKGFSPPYKSKYKLKFTDIELNVGYYKSSYVIYIFNSRFKIKNEDCLVFHGDDKEVSIRLELESILFDGEYKFVMDNEILSFVKTQRFHLNSINTFQFSILRLDSKTLNEIISIENLHLLYYDSSFDNYHRLIGNDKWCDIVSNEILLQHLLSSLQNNRAMLDDESDTHEESVVVDTEVNVSVDETVFVYLMRDNHSNMYKIGISKNPQYREKTLLSQSPNISLVYKREYPDREVARIMERTLHSCFELKRVRGEWFDLNDSDLIRFKSILVVD